MLNGCVVGAKYKCQALLDQDYHTQSDSLLDTVCKLILLDPMRRDIRNGNSSYEVQQKVRYWFESLLSKDLVHNGSTQALSIFNKAVDFAQTFTANEDFCTKLLNTKITLHCMEKMESADTLMQMVVDFAKDKGFMGTTLPIELFACLTYIQAENNNVETILGACSKIITPQNSIFFKQHLRHLKLLMGTLYSAHLDNQLDNRIESLSEHMKNAVANNDPAWPFSVIGFTWLEDLTTNWSNS